MGGVKQAFGRMLDVVKHWGMAEPPAEKPRATAWVDPNEEMPGYGIRVLIETRGGRLLSGHVVDGKWFDCGVEIETPRRWAPIPE